MIRGVIVIRDIRLRGSGMVCIPFPFLITNPPFHLPPYPFAPTGHWVTRGNETPVANRCGKLKSGIPKVMASSKTLATEIVSNSPTELVFKLRQEYTPRLVHFSKPVNSLVSLTFDEDGDKVKYHKDMWNEKDYSHEGLGKVMKTLNGDHLTKITRPEGDL